MEDRQTDRLIESIAELMTSIDNLTTATIEVAIKLKRLTNSNPITPEIYHHIVKTVHNESNKKNI